MVRVGMTKDKGVRCRQKMFYRRLIPIIARASWRDVDVGNDQFVFPISAFMVSSSRWGSDSDSGHDGCLEKVIDL